MVADDAAFWESPESATPPASPPVSPQPPAPSTEPSTNEAAWWGDASPAPPSTPSSPAGGHGAPDPWAAPVSPPPVPEEPQPTLEQLGLPTAAELRREKMRREHRPLQSMVPKVVGLPTGEAVALLEENNLVAVVQEFDPEVIATAPSVYANKPRNVVLAQNPPGGTILDHGTNVLVRELRDVDKNAPKTAVGGKSRSKLWWVAIGGIALVLVLAALLSAGSESETPTPTPNPSSSPTASTLNPTTAPNPTASTKPSPSATRVTPTVTVPGLAGLSVEEAETVAESAGFLLAPPLFVADEEKEDEVLSQYPTSGTSAEEGTRMLIVVAKDPGANKEIPIPDLVGVQEANAVADLMGLGLSTTQAVEVDSGQPAGQVIQQIPAPGLKGIKKETIVQLFVSNGKVAMPNVVGLKEKQAASELVARGFSVRVFEMPSSEKPGRVIAQAPTKGELVDAGETVAITVAAPTSVPAPATPAPTDPAPSLSP